jgi:hypothetical protein
MRNVCLSRLPPGKASAVPEAAVRGGPDLLGKLRAHSQECAGCTGVLSGYLVATRVLFSDQATTRWSESPACVSESTSDPQGSSITANARREIAMRQGET